MIKTLDEMINTLERLKAEHGGKTPIVLEDPDTSWLLKFIEADFNSSEKGKFVALYSDYEEENRF